MKHKGYSVFPLRRKFAVEWTAPGGKRKRVSGVASRSVANEIGRRQSSNADRVRGGVVTAAEHSAMEAMRSDVFKHLDDWKAMLRAKGNTAKHVLQNYTRALGLLKQMGARRLSDITGERVQAALAVVADNSSPNTARHYLVVFRGFIRFCLRTGRLLHDPLISVERPQVAGETFLRVPINHEQFAELLAVTRDERGERSKAARTPIPGPERSRYYEVLAGTGFRKSEALSLTPESFKLDGDDPTITVGAAYSKHRRRDEQLISKELADSLRPWLAGKRPGKNVFDFPACSNLHRIFRRDCKAAGIEGKTRAEGEVLGIHSLRRLYITSVGRAAGLAVAQELARHGNPALTKKYMDLTRHDLRKGLTGLPKPVSEPVSNKKAG